MPLLQNIGHSLGVTFPKEVASTFNMKGKTIRLIPDLEKGMIHMEVG